MATKLDVIARYDGVSSTGSAHVARRFWRLLIETANNGTVRFTVTGHDGKKRHAAVTLPDGVVAALLDTLRTHVVASIADGIDDADGDDFEIAPWEEIDA